MRKTMPGNLLDTVSAANSATSSVRRPRWLWSGFLKTGRITLWTGYSGIGKSTLLAGLLRNLNSHRNFLGRSTRSARAKVVCKNPPVFWRIHNHSAPLGNHLAIEWVGAMPTPTLPQWIEQVEEMIEYRNNGIFDLFVVDSIDRRFPACWRENPEQVFAPLQHLAAASAAVLLLYDCELDHNSNRSVDGWGLLNHVDYAFELRDFGRNQYRQRQLVRLKGPPLAPERIPYEYDGVAGFTAIDDPETVRFENAWKVLNPILQSANEPLTAVQIVARWPQSATRPIMSGLQKWLKRADDERKVKRLGRGLRGDPYRYRLVR